MKFVVGCIGALLVVVGWSMEPAVADEADAPSGPEACVTDEVNQRRSAGELRWSGVIRDELRDHAADMADRGELDHAAMSTRVAGLPDGWGGYGEASFSATLEERDDGQVREWCRSVVDSFWASPSHHDVLTDGSFDFISVGTHWDGADLWVAVGVFEHGSYQPGNVAWPENFAEGLGGDWSGHFLDDDDSIFEADIDRLAAAGLTQGCNPPRRTRYCPDSTVTRGEMAAFLARALGWDGTASSRFVDVGSSVFASDIAALAGRGITGGCNPPVNDRFCPDRAVTRGEIATFLARALELEPGGEGRFTDTATSVHRRHIRALAAAGLTAGCNPNGTRYCPEDHLTRGEMAALLVRAGLAG